MATPKELRAEIVEARAEFLEALHEAHAKWETKPAGAAEGEAAWSPKEIAQHVAGADWYFTDEICKACGAPPVARPPFDTSTPGKTAATITRNAAKYDDLMRHVSDADLQKQMGEKFAAGTVNVEQALVAWAAHIRDHANQLRTASA